MSAYEFFEDNANMHIYDTYKNGGIVCYEGELYFIKAMTEETLFDLGIINEDLKEEYLDVCNDLFDEEQTDEAEHFLNNFDLPNNNLDNFIKYIVQNFMKPLPSNDFEVFNTYHCDYPLFGALFKLEDIIDNLDDNQFNIVMEVIDINNFSSTTHNPPYSEINEILMNKIKKRMNI